MSQMGPPLASVSTSMVAAPSQGPIIMPTAAPSVPLLSMEWCSALAAEWDKVPTPYIAEGFRKALEAASLTLRYPSMVHDIKFGSPIGEPPPLLHTTIMPNLISAKRRPDIVSDYIAEEVALGRMAGPFHPG